MSASGGTDRIAERVRQTLCRHACGDDRTPDSHRIANRLGKVAAEVVH